MTQRGGKRPGTGGKREGAGRHRKDRIKRSTASYYLPDVQQERIVEISAESGHTQSEIVEMAIADFIRKFEKEMS